MSDGELTQTKQLQLEFWEGVNQRLASSTTISARKSSPKQWVDYSIGRTGFVLRATLSTQQNRLAVALYIQNKNADAFFQLLSEHQGAIASETDLSLDWQPLPNKQACRISTDIDIEDPSDKSSWPELQEWTVSTLEEIHRCFARRVKSLVLEG